jgi:hypothetical protein
MMRIGGLPDMQSSLAAAERAVCDMHHMSGGPQILEPGRMVIRFVRVMQQRREESLRPG